MPSTDEPAPEVRRWERFLKDHYRVKVNEAVLGWPKKRSLEVDWLALHRVDEDAAQFLLDHPYESLAAAHEVLNLIDLPDDGLTGPSRPKLIPRVVNLPAASRVGVADLRMEHAGKLVSVQGVVQAVAPVTAKLQEGLFLCERCGNAMLVPQDEHLTLTVPTECQEDKGGCGRDSKFKLVVGHHRGKTSHFVDLQVAILQETPEGIVGTRPPVRVPCFIEDDLCGALLPSDRIKVNAIVRTAHRDINRKKSNIFDFFLEVVSIEREARDYDEIEPTPEELAKMQELAASPDLVDNVVGSIAPTIYGRHFVKLAIAMQLFGGVTKNVDGRHIRGDIHVLVVGDPGVAKSVLGKSAAALSPRGIFVNALTASVAGVVGGVEKVERSLAGEGYVYQAGAVSMAHRGLMYLDEADKPRDEALLPALLEPLEQQTASLNKHGARGIMVKCEFALLAGANPKNGRYDPKVADKLSQFDFPRPFMDRMDLVFAIMDTPDEANDARLVDMMLRTHAAGTARMRGEAGENEGPKPIIETDFLRKYIAYAKRTVHPSIPAAVGARIKAKYLMQRRRRSSDEDSPVGYSPRTVDSLTRLAEASARMRLSNEVSDEDLDLATRVYNAGWEQLATNERGQLDADRLGSAPAFDMRESMRQLKIVVRDVAGEEGRGGDEFVAEAVRRGIDRDRAVSAIGRWKKDGTLMERAPGRWVLAETYRMPAKPAESTGDDRRVRWS